MLARATKNAPSLKSASTNKLPLLICQYERRNLGDDDSVTFKTIVKMIRKCIDSPLNAFKMKMTIQVLLHLKHWNFKDKKKILGIVNNCFVNRGPHVYIKTLFDTTFRPL
jgi:hypothetical protein